MVISEFMLILTLVSVLALLIRLLIQRRNINRTYSLLPGPKQQHPILGDLPILVGRCKKDGNDFHVVLLQSLLALSHIFRKEGLCRIWFAYDPYVFLYSAETVEPVLISQKIISKSRAYGLLHCWLGTGLLTSTGNKWRKRRKLITPTFHYNILDTFVPIFDRHSKVFVRKLQTLLHQEWVDVVPLASHLTLDVICETAMGIKIRSQEEEFCEYAKAIAEFCEILMKRAAKPWLQNDLIFSQTTDGKKLKKIVQILHSFSAKVVKQRKEELLKGCHHTGNKRISDPDEKVFGRKNRRCFLDLLLETQLAENSLSDEDICEEVDTFMFEGHDTISAGISWTLYHLGHYPKIQEQIYEEIQQIFNDDKDRPITSNDLREMKYLECVIKESQRLSPSVPLISRSVSEDVTIKDHVIPRGTTFTVFIYSLHRDPATFPDPEVFKPERFLPENSIGKHPFVYLPFSAGPRNCVGQKFAMMEIKIAICNVVRNFVVSSLDSPDSILCSALLILRPENGLKLTFTNRK